MPCSWEGPPDFQLQKMFGWMHQQEKMRETDMTHSSADAIEALKRGDHVLAFQEALRSAQEGNVSGQSNVAAFYATGTGVDQNFAEALKWWQRAAEQGMLGA